MHMTNSRNGNTLPYCNSFLGGLPRGEALLNHWMLSEKVKSKLEAWVTLLAMADHDGKTVSVKGYTIQLERGSILTTQQKLTELWGWNRKAVQRFLDRLKKEGLLDVQTTPNYSILVVQSEVTTYVPTCDHTEDSEKSGKVWITDKFDAQIVPTFVPRSEPTNIPNMTQDEREILQILHGIDGWKPEFEKDLGHIRKLMIEFETIDIKEEVTKFGIHKLDKPLKKNGNHRLALRNWIKMASERGTRGYATHQKGSSYQRHSRAGSADEERGSRFANKKTTRL